MCEVIFLLMSLCTRYACLYSSALLCWQDLVQISGMTLFAIEKHPCYESLIVSACTANPEGSEEHTWCQRQVMRRLLKICYTCWLKRPASRHVETLEE